MPLEIERKFLLKNDFWREEVQRSQEIRQGYLNSDPERAVRVRVKGKKGVLTIKGLGNGISRPEFEYSIPLEEAKQLLALCEKPLIEKVRYEVRIENHLWEIDEFTGANAGLVVAEIELLSEDEAFIRPAWLGEEVTDDVRYFNVELVRCPYSEW